MKERTKEGDEDGPSERKECQNCSERLKQTDSQLQGFSEMIGSSSVWGLTCALPPVDGLTTNSWQIDHGREVEDLQERP